MDAEGSAPPAVLVSHTEMRGSTACLAFCKRKRRKEALKRELAFALHNGLGIPPFIFPHSPAIPLAAFATSYGRY